MRGETPSPLWRATDCANFTDCTLLQASLRMCPRPGSGPVDGYVDASNGRNIVSLASLTEAP